MAKVGVEQEGDREGQPDGDVMVSILDVEEVDRARVAFEADELYRLPAGQRVVLEAWVDLPDGGIQRFHALSTITEEDGLEVTWDTGFEEEAKLLAGLPWSSGGRGIVSFVPDSEEFREQKRQAETLMLVVNGGIVRLRHDLSRHKPTKEKEVELEKFLDESDRLLEPQFAMKRNFAQAIMGSRPTALSQMGIRQDEIREVRIITGVSGDIFPRRPSLVKL